MAGIMKNDVDERNARIESTMLGIEDHGILTACLTLDYDGSGQGFGMMVFDHEKRDGQKCATPFAARFIRSVLETVGVDNWEDLPGKNVRVRATHDKVHAIGNILKNKWFYPEKLAAEIVPRGCKAA